MHPRARRLLSWTFILAFFVIAPAIIFTTAGYRYNFSKKRFERTGVLIVESRPAGASVTVGGELRKPVTPARITQLSPASYDVLVKKEGYLPWEKTVTVASRQTTFMSEVSLFRTSTPTLVAETLQAVNPNFSPDGRHAAAMLKRSTGSELMIVDLKTGIELVPYRSSLDAQRFRLAWSKTGERLLVTRSGTDPAFLLWNALAPETVDDLEARSGLVLNDAFWGQGDGRLYAVSGDVLDTISVDALVPASAGPAVASAVVADGWLYGIRSGKPATLVRRRLKDETFETVAELPNPDFVPIDGDDGKVAYVSATGDRLFVIDPSQGQPKAFETRGRGGVWSADGRRLLYWNDLELRLYDHGTGADELLTRLSGAIVGAAWHHPEWTALYASGGGLYAIETTDRFGRVTTKLAEFDEIAEFAVSRNGDDAYVFGKKSGAAGLWRVRLR